jgi:hypothetical protein
MEDVKPGAEPAGEQPKPVLSSTARKVNSLFATALSAADPPWIRDFEQRLCEATKPEGALENLLVDQIALTYLRMHRCARAEAALHETVWEPLEDFRTPSRRRRKSEPPEELVPVPYFRRTMFQAQVNLMDTFQMRLANCLFRSLHELERMQRMRKGEFVPAPLAGELMQETFIRVARGPGGKFAPAGDGPAQPPSGNL